MGAVPDWQQWTWSFLHHACVSVLNQDKETGFHKEFCWIRFSSEEGLNNALQKYPHVLEGAKVKLTLHARIYKGWSLHSSHLDEVELKLFLCPNFPTCLGSLKAHFHPESLLHLSDDVLWFQLQVQRNNRPFAGQRSYRDGDFEAWWFCWVNDLLGLLSFLLPQLLCFAQTSLPHLLYTYCMCFHISMSSVLTVFSLLSPQHQNMSKPTCKWFVNSYNFLSGNKANA